MVAHMMRLRRRISAIFGILTGIIGGILFVLTITQIVARLIADDIDWIFETLRILLSMSVAVGVFAASLQDGHFRVNLGSGKPSGPDNPNFFEVLRHLIILGCVGFLFVVGIPTIAKTRMHPLTTLPGDYSIFRIIYLSGIGGMLLAHLWLVLEMTVRLFSGHDRSEQFEK